MTGENRMSGMGADRSVSAAQAREVMDDLFPRLRLQVISRLASRR